MVSRGFVFALFAAFLSGLGTLPGKAQSPQLTLEPDAAPASAEALIQQMSLAAGVIFAGEVMAVRRPAGYTGSGQDAVEGVVEIDFRVDEVVRPASGLEPGSIYTLREWPGLWTGNGVRYKVGQRLLMFLHAPNERGFSSPVHGAEGAIPLRGGGAAPGPDDSTTGASQWMVDLRWLQTLVQRRGPWGVLPVRTPLEPRGTVAEYASPGLLHVVPAPLLVPDVTLVETEPLAQVLNLCRNAIEQRDAQR